MRSDGKIFIAFLLNISFSCFELLGGMFTGSVAILSDAVHDMGDAISIGLSYILERKSKRQPDETHTYGYGGYSTIGGIITTLILLTGSTAVICNAIIRLFHPTPIHHRGMILFAFVGAAVNLAAVFFTRGGDSLNQRAVNLHMLEDVLGWLVVLAGAVIIRFTNLVIIDPILSIGVSLFILIHAAKNLKQMLILFLARTPDGIDIKALKKDLTEIDGVIDVHHIHIWTTDGNHNYATMHIVTNADSYRIKNAVRSTLCRHRIPHATLELEKENERCSQLQCTINPAASGLHHHKHCI